MLMCNHSASQIDLSVQATCSHHVITEKVHIHLITAHLVSPFSVYASRRCYSAETCKNPGDAKRCVTGYRIVNLCNRLHQDKTRDPLQQVLQGSLLSYKNCNIVSHTCFTLPSPK
jgi:hypothetical protein